MGRRALRKLDPQLDLSSFLFEPSAVPVPFDSATFFGRASPLEIEVGSGKGLFMQSACELHPAHNFLGIEIAKKYARHCAARLSQRGLANGKMLCGDATRFFAEALPSASVAAVHVYFPDPWWKKRHKKRRVMNERFVHQIERVLEPRGELHFWTDVEEYFQVTLELLAAQTKLHGPELVLERPAEHGLDYRTHFERRMRLRDLPVFRARFFKRGAADCEAQSERITLLPLENSASP